MNVQNKPASRRAGVSAQPAAPPPLTGASGIALVNSLEGMVDVALKNLDTAEAGLLRNDLILRLRLAGVAATDPVNTPYVNTIPVEAQPGYPGDRDLERRIKSLARWNAMAMVVNANSRLRRGRAYFELRLDGHALRGGLQSFFPRRRRENSGGLDLFSGPHHARQLCAGVFGRPAGGSHLQNFRQELAEGGGLSSYPHPYLMPDFWQFPTVSMGLGPMMSIYQARFIRYLKARGLLQAETEPRVWAFVGDGKSDEPETLGSLTLASREGLDNLTWVVNCNLQRLDGPVRGNGKIIQELEGAFHGEQYVTNE